MAENTLQSNGNYFLWPEGEPLPKYETCWGCKTRLVVFGGLLKCYVCGGDEGQLALFQDAAKALVENDDFNSAHAANKVRKQVRVEKKMHADPRMLTYKMLS